MDQIDMRGRFQLWQEKPRARGLPAGRGEGPSTFCLARCAVGCVRPNVLGLDTNMCEVGCTMAEQQAGINGISDMGHIGILQELVY